jgi:hypothetical protein
MVSNDGLEIVKSEYKMLFEALRHREEAIIQYLAILGPALGGFVWLLLNVGYDATKTKVFVVGTVGVMAVLWMGAMYSLALGFNFRYITLVLAKIEAKLGADEFTILGWPRSPKAFLRKYRLCRMPWCTPPEIIWIFWISFLIFIPTIAAVALIFINGKTAQWFLMSCGVVFFLSAWLVAPIVYGFKLKYLIENELEHIESWQRCEN